MSTTTTTTVKTGEQQKRTFGTQYEEKDLVDFDPSRHYGDWRDEFHQKGCVLIKNVISKERAQYYVDKQVQWLKNFDLGYDPDDKSTWTADHLPVSFKGGMYFAYGSTHENYVWEARTEPAVVDIFEKLWETKELICSFDGVNIFPPRKDLNWSPWPHCDQNPKRKGYVRQRTNTKRATDHFLKHASRPGSAQLRTQWRERRRPGVDEGLRKVVQRLLLYAAEYGRARRCTAA